MGNFMPNTSPAPGVQLGIYKDRFYSGDSYFHYKTNIPMSNIMCMIEAIGYSYGNGVAIRSAWGFYAYAGTNDVINVGLYNIYGGMTAHGVYKSSDGYAVIRASTAPYFSGWVFNAYCLQPAGYNFKVSIISSVQTSNSGNYY